MTGAQRPEFDAELRAGLAVVGGMFPPTITSDLIEFMRVSYASPPVDDLLAERGIVRHDVTVPGYLGAPMTVSVLRHRDVTGLRPGVLYAHSGGLMFGDRFSGIDLVLDWVDRLGVVLVTVEYRLAPEHPDPFPREDGVARRRWCRGGVRCCVGCCHESCAPPGPRSDFEQLGLFVLEHLVDLGDDVVRALF